MDECLVPNAMLDESSQVNSKHYSEQFYDRDSVRSLFMFWVVRFSCRFPLAELKRRSFLYELNLTFFEAWFLILVYCLVCYLWFIWNLNNGVAFLILG